MSKTNKRRNANRTKRMIKKQDARKQEDEQGKMNKMNENEQEEAE